MNVNTKMAHLRSSLSLVSLEKFMSSTIWLLFIPHLDRFVPVSFFSVCHSIDLIHTDLKLENILLVNSDYTEITRVGPLLIYIMRATPCASHHTSQILISKVLNGEYFDHSSCYVLYLCVCIDVGLGFRLSNSKGQIYPTDWFRWCHFWTRLSFQNH